MSGRCLGSGIGRRTLIGYGSRGEALDSIHDLLMTMFAFASVSGGVEASSLYKLCDLYILMSWLQSSNLDSCPREASLASP